MAVPTLEGFSTGVGGTNGVDAGMPANATTDDLIWLVIESWGNDSGDAAVSPPTGGAWTLVGYAVSGTDTGAERTNCTVYWAEYNVDLNLTVPDTGDHTTAQAYAFRGVDLADPFEDTSSGANGTATSAHSAVTGITTAATDRLVVLGYTFGDGAPSAPAAWANTSLTDVSGPDYFQTNSGNDGTVGMIEGERLTAGTAGTFTWTSAADEDDAWVAAALQPPAGIVYTQLTAAPTGTGSVTALPQIGNQLTADPTGTATVAAKLAVLQDVTATIAGTGTITSGLETGLLLAATIANTATVTATLTIIHQLTGGLSASATIDTLLDVTTSLTGTIQGAATFTTSLSTAATTQLASTIQSTATVGAALDITQKLVASLTGTGTLDATLTQTGTANLAAVVTGPATITTTVDVIQALTATLQSTATVGATLETLLYLTAPISGTATLVATPTVGTTGNNLTGIMSGSATIEATLNVVALLTTTLGAVGVSPVLVGAVEVTDW